MSGRTWLLRPEQRDWDRWLEHAPHDVYHGAAYHALAERNGEGRAHLLVHGTAERFVAWPYLVRDIGDGHVDGCSVYGYSGPFGTGLHDPAFLARAWSAFRKIWAEQRLVTLFTRFHPLLGNARHCAALHGAGAVTGGELLTVGRSVSVDLSVTAEERRRAYRKVLRQEIAAAYRAGLVVAEDRDWRHLARFGELYRATMARNAASARYRFEDAYLAELRRAFGDAGHLALARVGDTPIALLLFTVSDGIAQAHLTGVSADWHHLSPLKALIDGTADLARSCGATRLHLGAGRGGYEDSLFDFKSRFSPIRHDFTLGRWILDPVREKDLSMAVLPDERPDGRFFPRYRAPRTSGET